MLHKNKSTLQINILWRYYVFFKFGSFVVILPKKDKDKTKTKLRRYHSALASVTCVLCLGTAGSLVCRSQPTPSYHNIISSDCHKDNIFLYNIVLRVVCREARDAYWAVLRNQRERVLFSTRLPEQGAGIYFHCLLHHHHRHYHQPNTIR